MSEILTQLDQLLEARKSESADTSYVASLYAKGLDQILKKLGEETIETVMAAKDNDPDHLIYEVSDLWFHSLVLLAHKNLSSADVLKELERRFGLSGLVEKAQREQ